MVRPVPPTHWLTRTPETREDLRKIREYLRELQEYIDSLSTGGGSSGPITLAGDVTGASDANLVSKLQGIPLTTTGGSAGDVLTYDGTDLVLAASVPATPDQAYITPPVTPNAFDDEFDAGGNPDLAARGWLFRNMTTGTLMTRIGDVVPFGLLMTALTANQYRSTLSRGRLFLQLPSGIGQDVVLARAITVPASVPTDGAFVVGRVGFQNFVASGSSVAGGYYNVSVYQDTGGLPDMSNRAWNQVYQNGNQIVHEPASVIGGGFSANTVTYGVSQAIPDILGVRAHGSGASVIEAFTINAVSGHTTTHQINSASLVPQWAGLGFYQQTGSPSPSFLTIDFLRLVTGDMTLFSNWVA